MPLGANFDIDLLRKNPNSKVIFAWYGGATVEGFMIDETFKVEGTAHFEGLFEQGAAGTLLGRFGREVGAVAAFGKKVAQVQFKSALETRLSWVGCDTPEFQVTLLFVVVRATDDPRKQVKILLDAVYPIKTSGMILSPPVGYGLAKEQGKAAVSIGKWFRATGQVVTNASFEFSREVVKCENSFVPLYAQGTVSFKPWRMIDASEIRGYFVG